MQAGERNTGQEKYNRVTTSIPYAMSTLSIEQLFSVKGYVAVVTGGSSGLGFMISKVRYNCELEVHPGYIAV